VENIMRWLQQRHQLPSPKLLACPFDIFIFTKSSHNIKASLGIELMMLPKCVNERTIGPGAREDEERVFAIEKFLWVLFTNTCCAKGKRYQNEEFLGKKIGGECKKDDEE
jgi:hypothetical protein